MTSTLPPDPGAPGHHEAWRVRPAAVVVGTLGVLATFNVVRATGVFGNYDSVANVGLLVTLVIGAWLVRAPAEALGTTRRSVGSGIRWGLGTMAVIALALAIAAVVPTSMGFLDDNRADLTPVQLGTTVVLGILVATVLPEEFAFRGLLLGAALGVWSRTMAVAVTSVAFGLWHIAPTLTTASDNAVAANLTTSMWGTVGVVAANVVATAVAGVVFAWLRLRSASLMAPVLAHLGTNATALITAWVLMN